MQNRLGDTLSPYLLGHAHNPVAWQPWDDEAFALARKLDKPIFLSIGYATCHWCHVMERESFEDAEVAEVLNRVFVPVKVDREERPDVDAVYMEVAQMTSGRGGWPLTVLLTPDARPFFVATYLPPRARYGRAGVVELARGVEEAWEKRRDDIEASAQNLTDALQSRWAEAPEPDGPTLSEETLHRAFAQLQQRFDAEHGGWGGAPKFPTPHVGRFLLRYARRYENPEAREMVARTLRAMRAGGIFDQVGYGFHRYSTDKSWTLPHFEKMLYDQAGLLALYADAAAATGEAAYATVVDEIVTYLTRDLMDEVGAFYAAEDADSEGREGAFYVWTRAQLDEALGVEEAARFVRTYNVTDEGNFEDEATAERTGENVLFLGTWPQEGAAAEQVLDRLREVRNHRPRPLLDDKILTDWNALAVSALAQAGRALGKPVLLELAERAMRFVLDVLRDADGRLLHRARDGQAGLTATADDYAFTIRALLDLYQATQSARWLVDAVKLQQDFNTFYFDEKRGAYRLAPSDGEQLITSTVAFYDGATPSANSVAALNLVHLSRLTGDVAHAERARRLFDAAAADVHAMPSGFAALLLALDEDVHAPADVVLAVAGGADAQPFLDAYRRARPPGSLLAVLDVSARRVLADVSPYLAAYPIPETGVKAYVCQNLHCEAPVADPAALEALLQG